LLWPVSFGENWYSKVYAGHSLSFRLPFLKNDLPIFAHQDYQQYTFNDMPMLNFLLERKFIDFSSHDSLPMETILQSY
jgi:hypothetical protein